MHCFFSSEVMLLRVGSIFTVLPFFYGNGLQKQAFPGPMVRVGTLPFRLLAAEYDADITYGEEIIDHRLLKCERRFNDMFAKRYLELLMWLRKKTINVVLRTCAEERGRVVLYIGTSDAIRALRAAETVHQEINVFTILMTHNSPLMFSTHNDAATLRMRFLDVAAIDGYMSYPKSISISGGMGAALLTKPELIHDILTTLKRNLDTPVTCKIRLLKSSQDTTELARRIEKTGVSALPLHGRLLTGPEFLQSRVRLLML
ncbi:uncharacterized protein LOC142521704 isoform X2 [Primulina tabacum]|uniref:uncharacterized protein LOC142521704 isoform X2 n=1 Tax=Primulina tabacum TaxID=48773 RepID=UPI003F590F33